MCIGEDELIDDFDGAEILPDDMISFDDMDRKIANQCVAIFSHQTDNDRYIGAGVLYDRHGSFISVGHNFKNVSIPHHAYFGGMVYDIELAHMEYNDELGLDLFIGSLKDFTTDAPISLIDFIDSKDIKDGTPVKACGYKSVESAQRCRLTYEPLSPGIEITGNLSLNQYIVSCKTISREQWIQNNPGSFKGRKEQDIYIYSDLPTDGCRFKGISGGPVYIQDGIIGVTVSDLFIRTEYIRSRLSR